MSKKNKNQIVLDQKKVMGEEFNILPLPFKVDNFTGNAKENNILLSLIIGARIIPTTNSAIYNITQPVIASPAGTLPIINNIPDAKSNVASKFLILNARYEADATKNANKANIVAPKGVMIWRNIQ